MSYYVKLYGSEPSGAFNIRDFHPKISFDSIVAGTLQSSSVISSNLIGSSIQIQNDNGDNLDVATHQDISDAINNLVAGTDGAYDTLKEIQTFLQNDDNQISSILSGLTTKADQSALDTTNTNVSNLTDTVSTIQTSLTADESTLASHTSSINTINSTLANKADQSSLNTTNTNLATLTTRVTNDETTLSSHTSSISSINSTLQTRHKL